MERLKWIERRFNFPAQPGLMPFVIERLHGTEIRIRNMIAGIDEDSLGAEYNSKWSIKQHIGHLTDLESLHEGRIDDFIAKKEILRAADMKNAATEAANHNLKSINELMDEFSKKRNYLIMRFENTDDATQNFQSLHPRLQQLILPVDSAYFCAEHDDHHLASMREIIRSHIA